MVVLYLRAAEPQLGQPHPSTQLIHTTTVLLLAVLATGKFSTSNTQTGSEIRPELGAANRPLSEKHGCTELRRRAQVPPALVVF